MPLRTSIILFSFVVSLSGKASLATDSNGAICPLYPFGLNTTYISDAKSTVAVDRSKIFNNSFDSILKAKEVATIKAKSQLAAKEKTSSLIGVVVLFDCVKDDFVYVGITVASKNKNAARDLNKLMKDSIVYQPVLK
jgi:hypothetical protein